MKKSKTGKEYKDKSVQDCKNKSGKDCKSRLGVDGKNKFIKGFKNYFSTEIAIEYKACLYFYAILFFYCVFLVIQGQFQASVLHMAEMILTTYLMGYLQVYLLGNFDEAENLGKREAVYTLFCSALYTGASYLLGWFDKSLAATLIFLGFIAFAYWCVYLINKIKRKIDTENLNNMLTEYKKTGNFMCVEPGGIVSMKQGAEKTLGAGERIQKMERAEPEEIEEKETKVEEAKLEEAKTEEPEAEETERKSPRKQEEKK